MSTRSPEPYDASGDECDGTDWCDACDGLCCNDEGDGSCRACRGTGTMHCECCTRCDWCGERCEDPDLCTCPGAERERSATA